MLLTWNNFWHKKNLFICHLSQNVLVKKKQTNQQKKQKQDAMIKGNSWLKIEKWQILATSNSNSNLKIAATLYKL